MSSLELSGSWCKISIITMIVGIGIDCEEIARWEGLSKSTISDARYLLFSEHEHEYCSSGACRAQHYAGRWCLKEAAVKALSGMVAITTRDIEVRHALNRSPEVKIAGRIKIPPEISIMASVTHSEKSAAAVVLVQSRLS